MANIVGNILGFFLIVIIIFLVFRETICWYWKINQNVALLTEIRDLLVAKENPQGAVAPVEPQSHQKIGPSGEQ